MRIPRRCQLFIFAILIGLAALLLPKIAAASTSLLSCGKMIFRMNEAAGTVSHRGNDGRWGQEFPLQVSDAAYRWEVKIPATPQFTDYYLIELESLELTYRRCSGNDCEGAQAVCLKQAGPAAL